LTKNREKTKKKTKASMKKKQENKTGKQGFDEKNA